MEYLGQEFDSSGNILQLYWDPSSNSLVVVDGNTGVTLGSQVYPSREGAIAAIQAKKAQAQANAPDTRSTLTKAKDWLEEEKEKHEAKKLSELGLKVREARAQQALDTISNQKQAAAAQRIEKTAKALGTIATGGGVSKKGLAMYDSPELREMSVSMDWAKGGRGQSLAALKHVTGLPESDLRSATLPAAKKSLHEADKNLGELRQAVKPLSASKEVNNPYKNVRRSAPDLTALQVSTTPKLRRVQGYTLPSSARTIPVGQYVKPPQSLASSQNFVQVKRTETPQSPLSQASTKSFRLGELNKNTEGGALGLASSQAPRKSFGAVGDSKIAQVARQRTIFTSPNRSNTSVKPQVLSIKRKPSYYGKTIKKLGQGIR